MKLDLMYITPCGGGVGGDGPCMGCTHNTPIHGAMPIKTFNRRDIQKGKHRKVWDKTQVGGSSKQSGQKERWLHKQSHLVL